jgi:hypothetical protein
VKFWSKINLTSNPQQKGAKMDTQISKKKRNVLKYEERDALRTYMRNHLPEYTTNNTSIKDVATNAAIYLHSAKLLREGITVTEGNIQGLREQCSQEFEGWTTKEELNFNTRIESLCAVANMDNTALQNHIFNCLVSVINIPNEEEKRKKLMKLYTAY